MALAGELLDKKRPGAARRLVTFLARPRKVTKGRPPRCRALYSQGHPALPASMWRLRNSTWRGTHNVPHCGTDSVPGGRELGAETESWAPVSTLTDRVIAPVPANGAPLNVSQGNRGTVRGDLPPPSRAARRATRGRGKARTRRFPPDCTTALKRQRLTPNYLL